MVAVHGGANYVASAGVLLDLHTMSKPVSGHFELLMATILLTDMPGHWSHSVLAAERIHLSDLPSSQ